MALSVVRYLIRRYGRSRNSESISRIKTYLNTPVCSRGLMDSLVLTSSKNYRIMNSHLTLNIFTRSGIFVGVKSSDITRASPTI